MKSQTRKVGIIAALCLASGLHGAHAAINNGAPTVQPLGSGSSGEMFLRVFDATAQATFAIDLGISVENFLATNAVSRSWDLTSVFREFAALSDGDLLYNVAGNNTYPTVSDTSGQFGVLLSRRDDQNTYDVTTQSVASFGSSWGVKISASAIGTNTGMLGSGADQSDYAANLAYYTTDTSNTGFWTKLGMGGDFGVANYVGAATAYRDGSTLVGSTLDLGWYHSPEGTLKSTTKMLWEVQDGYLSLDIANAQLAWHSNVAPVPIPGAVWLFATGLAGLLMRRSAVNAGANT